MVFQSIALMPWGTVLTNVAFGLKIRGVPRSDRESKAMELLDLVGLSGFENRLPGELSGGMQQRVGLARALAVDPKILLMDEPFGALDPITRAELHREFRALQAKLPRAVLLVTHDLSEAFALANRVAVLHQGRIVACEAPDALARVDDPHVRQLLETRFG